jgi:cobalamin synthase
MSIGQAFNYLTLADDASELHAGPAGIAVLSLPLAGLFIGLALMLVNRAAESYLASEILGFFLLTILIVATAGRHLSGLEKTFSRAANASATSTNGRPLAGLLAVLLVVMFKAHAIALAGEIRAFSLLLTPLLARWSLLLFLYGAVPARANGAYIARGVKPWHLIAASVGSLGCGFLVAGEQALWIALALSLLALAARSYAQYREDGVSLAHCGAVIEIGEALSFTLFASL